jgi:hypothetical protein
MRADRRALPPLLALLGAVITAGCATVPTTPLVWNDLTGQSRNNDDLRPDLAACNAVYSEALEQSQHDVPVDPTPGPSGLAMAMETLAIVNVWKSTANAAFNNCMRANNWQLART